MEINYVVVTNLHLKNPAGWVYEVQTGGRDYNTVEKAFYTIVGNNMHDKVHDAGSVIMIDSLGHAILSKSWDDSEPANEE